MKKAIAILCIVAALILLVPIKGQMKDGGTVHYDAILYDLYDVHRIKPVDPVNIAGSYETEYIEGIIVKILGVEIFNNTDPYVES